MLKKTGLFVVILSFLALLEPRSSQAQEIRIDGNTATIVTKDGDRITIDGNTLSRDGKNLFHSFQEFGLSQQQIATFLTNPNIQNILTRVTGSNPSYINGLIQVVGGNSNLFLMNPAGVVFGSGASINVPADFTATTATGIGFNNGVFRAVGSNDYSNLTGNPTNFVFNTNQPGSIINAGDLKVSEGSNINLIGGNVINTGSIETPHGKINIQAVAGTSRVKITPEGSLLSLELDIPKDDQGNLLGFTPQDLPTLLTGANNAGVATPNVTIKNNVVGVNGINPDKPQVQVANVNIPEGTGNSIVSGKVSTSSETLGGEITVLGEKVGVIEGEITADGVQGGGEVLIGGDREGKGTIPNAQVTYVSPDSKISADATVNGDGGQVIVFAEEYANIHGELTAKGGSVSGDGGFIETSGKTSFNITSIPNTSAVNGVAGEWLIDPLNVTIVSGSGDISDSGGTFTPPGSPSNTVGVDDLKSGLFVNNIVTVTTEAEGREEGNITWNSDATLDYDGIGIDKTLVLRADRNIIYQGTIQDSNPDALSPDSLNVTFNSNASGNGGGIDITGDMTTGGGHITLGGGGDPFSQPAIGTGDPLDPLDPNSRILNNGISIFGNLFAQGGNISITGQGLLNSSTGLNNGINLLGDANITTTGNGTITMTGTGGSNTTGTFAINEGINPSNESIIQAENGNINLIGVGGSDTLGLGSNNGIVLNGTFSTSGSGSIILDGSADTGDGLFITDFTSVTTSGSGNISLIGRSQNEEGIQLFGAGGNGLVSISTTGSGSISLLGETGNSTQNAITINRLSSTDPNRISINSAQNLEITGNGNGIFQETDSSTISSLGTTTLNSFAPNGDSIEPRDISLTGENNFNNLVIINGQDVTIVDTDAINLGSINVNSLNVNAGGEITDSDGVNVLGTITLSAGSETNPADITLNTAGQNGLNNFRDVAIVRGNNVILANDPDGMNLESSTISGDLTISTQGSITDTGTIRVTGSTSLFPIGSNILLDSTENDFVGQVNIQEANNVVIHDVNNLNFGVIGDSTPVNSFEATAQNISSTYINATSNITIDATGLFTATGSNINGNSLESTNGNITINHGGGDLNPRVPFTVGDASINGTSGSIVTSTESINPIQTYPNSFVTPNGTIQINTTNLDLPIVAATLELDGDATGSIVSSSDGLLIDITGGTLSGNSSNLFHSFTRFDLPQSDQTANFITETSGINNILARVISGDASIINGQIQVTGLSSPNLFLMNPAGIVFGNTASINVPADFVATTATGIGFGDNWFSANGNYNASLLNVDPINLAFTPPESGAIINASLLNNSNGDLSLLAGTQINTENISNTNNLNLTAIQGQNILDLTTFALIPASESATLPNTFTPAILTLDNLVTTALNEGTGNLGVTILGNNSLQVDSTGITLGLGDVSSQAINASNTNIRANRNVTLGSVGNSIDNNTLNVNANGQLQLLGTIETQGGDISIAGVSNFISPNNINTAGGNFNLETTTDYSLDFALFTEGGNFNLESLGSVAINDIINTNGGNVAVTGNSLSSSSAVITPFDSSNLTGNGGNITLTSTNGDINVNGLSSNSSSANGGEVRVNASSGNITLGNVNTFGGTTGNLTLNADGNIVNNGLIAVGGNTFLSGNNITLDNAGNDFQTVNLQNGVNVTLSDINDLTLANVDTLGNLANISISGDLSLQVTGTTNINSNIQANSLLTNGSTVINADTITTTLNQTYNNAVTLDNNVTLTTTDSSIEFANTVNSLTNSDFNVETGSGNISFNNGIESLGDVSLNSSGTTSVNGVNVNSLTTDEGGTTRLNGNVTTSGSQTYNDAVTLVNDVQLSGNNVTFSSSIDGSQSLTISGVSELGNVGSNTALSNLTTNGLTTLTGNVTTSGSQIYNDAVTLDNNVTLTTTDSSIEFANTVNSLTNSDLNVETGSGNISFNNGIESLGDVSLNSSGTTSLNTVNVNSLTTNEGGTTLLNGNVTTSGSQTYNDAVTLENNVILTTTDSSIEFANTVNSLNNSNLNVETGSGNISFNNGIESLGDVSLNSSGTTSVNGVNVNSLTTNVGGTTRLNGNVTTSGNQSYGDEVILNQDTVITTDNLNAPVIKVAEDALNPVSLAINAQSDITIAGEANNTGIPLGISTARSSGLSTGNITIDALGDININGAVNTTVDDVNSFVTQAGNIDIRSDGNLTALAIGTYGVASSGTLNITGSNLNLGAIISNSFSLPNFPPQPSSNGGIVTLTGTNINVQGSIFADSLTTNGTVNLSDNPLIINVPVFGEVLGRANIQTVNSQNYNGNVFLASPVTMTTTNNGMISLNQTVNSLTNSDLTVNTGSGNISFNNGIESLGDVSLNSSGTTSLNTVNANSLISEGGGETLLNGDVTTSGSQNYNDTVTLNNNVTLTTTNSSIEFANTVNSLINSDLNVETGIGNISFNNGIESLGDVSLNSSGTTSLNTVNVNSLTSKGGETTLTGNVTTSGNQEYNSAVTLPNETQLDGNNIIFNSSVNSQGGLLSIKGNNIEAGGNITSNGGSISLSAVNNLNTQNIDTRTTVNAQGGNVSLVSDNGNIQTGNINTNAGSVTLSASENIVTGNIESFFLNGSGGNVDINSGNDIQVGNIDTNSPVANGGNITLNAQRNISTGILMAEGDEGDIGGGNIFLSATNGEILANILDTSSANSNAGNVTVFATGNILIDGIDTSSYNGNQSSDNPVNNAGNVEINSQAGSITINNNIFAWSVNSNFNDPTKGQGGNVFLTAEGDINTEEILSNSNFSIAGEINLKSNNGNISIGNVSATGNQGNNITLNATEDITVNNINFGHFTSTLSGGTLTIETPATVNINGSISSTGGDIIIGTATPNEVNINGSVISRNGDITINSNGLININSFILSTGVDADVTISGFEINANTISNEITSQGNISLTSSDGDIIMRGDLTTSGRNIVLTAQGNIESAFLSTGDFGGNSNRTTNTGNVVISAENNINTGFISTYNSGSGSAGAVNINGGGFIQIQGIDTGSGNGNGGDININNEGNIQISDLVYSGSGSLASPNVTLGNGNGGNISLISNSGSINTNSVQSSSINGDGGNITLTTTSSDIEVSSINPRSNNGQGGDVNISTLGRLRVIETIDDTNISIDARGSNGGGAISIDFFPDNSQAGKTEDPRLPFVVGNPSSNGTQGIITNGEFSISPDKYFEVVEEGNINIVLLDPQPQPPQPPQPPQAPQPPTSVDNRQGKLNILKTNGDVNNSVETPVETLPETVAVAPPVLPIYTIAQTQEILTAIEREAAEKPAFIYVSFTPKGYQPKDLEKEFARREATNTQEYSRVNINKPNLQPTIALKPAEDDQLDLLVITNQGEPIRVTVPVTRQQMVDSALNLSIELSSDRLDEQYKPYAKELYSWLITPIEETLKEREISNLLFILPLNIRFVPIASLYDEKTEQFLVEKYSSGLAPSLNLNDNNYRSVKDLNLLAMGASEFAEDQQQTPLPGVGLELPTIKTIWNEQAPDNYQEFLNDNFTLETIKANLDKQPYGIIHFGTHGSFGADDDDDIFIQLYNSRLNFKDIGSLGLSRLASSVELMLLSACQTALGNDIAELGFAGLAVQAGVKSAIGTVWTIGDTGTLAFMTDFYGELKTQTTKAEALRQTQLNMLKGKVYKSDDGNTVITPNKSVSLEALPEDTRQPEDLSHPFYWAPFTLIGNPW